jgi:hypothetical protein
MIKLMIIFLCVISAFAIMLAGMFFGDYKKVRTRLKKERSGLTLQKKHTGFSSCAGCTGTDCRK